MLPVSAALNTYASASAATSVRRTEPVQPPDNRANTSTSNNGSSTRPSAVVNISEQGRAQADRAAAEQAPRAAVNAVQQAAVATSETSALQDRLSDARSEAPDAGASGSSPNAGDDAIRNAAGPASTDEASSQRKDGVRAG